MKATFTQRDAITPEIRRRLRKLDGAGKTGALEVMGIVVQTAAVESFTDETKRASPWPEKKDGTPATLQQTHALRQSYQRAVVATPRVVEIGSDRPYALAHQLGRKEAGLPARPTLPVDARGELLPEVKEDILGALGDYLDAL